MKFTSDNDCNVVSGNGQKAAAKKRGELTRRENEILELVAQGVTAREIATMLFVSMDTVETHKRNVVQKMEARNTVDAVAKALRMGLIE